MAKFLKPNTVWSFTRAVAPVEKWWLRSHPRWEPGEAVRVAILKVVIVKLFSWNQWMWSGSMDLGKKMACSRRNRAADVLQIRVESVSNQYWVLLVCVTAGKLRVFCLQIVGDLALCYFAFASACDFTFILFYNFYKLYLYIWLFNYFSFYIIIG